MNGNDSRVEFKVVSGKRSTAWLGFEAIYFGGVITNWVKCTGCNELLSSTCGTSSLARHLQKCLGQENSSNKTTPITEVERSKVKDLAVTVCAKELRPFLLFEGQAFRAFSQLLITIGAKHGPLSVDSVSVSFSNQCK